MQLWNIKNMLSIARLLLLNCQSVIIENDSLKIIPSLHIAFFCLHISRHVWLAQLVLTPAKHVRSHLQLIHAINFYSIKIHSLASLANTLWLIRLRLSPTTAFLTQRALTLKQCWPKAICDRHSRFYTVRRVTQDPSTPLLCISFSA